LRSNYDFGHREGIWQLEGQGSTVALHNQARTFTIYQDFWKIIFVVEHHFTSKSFIW